MTTHSRLVPLIIVATLAVACRSPPPPSEEPAPAPPQTQPAVTGVDVAVAIPNARRPLPGVLTGGQPTEAQIGELAQAGFGTVINLRSEREHADFEWEPAAVAAAGMRYVHIPIAGATDLTHRNAETLAEVLAAASDDGRPVALHCKSGNRVGALLALESVWVGGMSVDEALALGRAAGLTRLEEATRGLLAPD